MTPEKRDDMSNRISRSSFVIMSGLDVQLPEFLATLAKAGYAVKTQHDKRRAISPFIRWVRDARIAIAELDEAHIGAFLSRRRRKRRHPHARAALLQFLEHLRTVGFVPPRQSQPSSADMLVRRYLDHLRDNRGLCPRSLEVYAPFVRAFVVAQRLPETVLVLNASAILRTRSMGKCNCR